MTTTMSREVTDTHKQAMAAGRDEARTVRLYLEHIKANQPKRGRKRTKDSINRRLEKINIELVTCDVLKRVHLTQEMLNLRAELTTMVDDGIGQALEDDFVNVAFSYSARKGISYEAWRLVGVPSAVLTRAEITKK